MKWLVLIVSLLFTGAAHAQTPGVDCAPVQGQGWQGCAPLPNAQQVPQAQWQSRWGAIATDAEKGVLSAVTNRPSKQDATEAALADCQSKGGAQCVLQVAYDNQCAVLVLGDKAFNVANAATIGEATKIGIDKCSTASPNCHVHYSGCSLPAQVQ